MCVKRSEVAEFPGPGRVETAGDPGGWDWASPPHPARCSRRPAWKSRRGAPARATFTISLANGYNGYLPTPRDHQLGGSETWLARSSYLEVDASEKIRDELLRLMIVVAESAR